MSIPRYFWAAAFWAFLAGCSRAPSTDGADRAQWIERAREAHLQAAQASDPAQLDRARESLSSFVEQPAPRQIAPQLVQSMLQDSYFNLAQLALKTDRSAEALAWADRGLAFEARNDLFYANLLLARGQALEKLNRESEAAESYHRALLINESLLHEIGEMP